MITLYAAQGTVAAAAAIALREAGIEHRLAKLNFAEDEQNTPAFLALNPKGRVPVLETAQGTLTETPAILDWIAATAPEAGLLPEDPWQAGRVRELLTYCAATMHVNHAHARRAYRWADGDEARAAMKAKVPETMAACCAHLETTLPFAPFALGERITLADCHLYTICQWLPGDGVEVAAYPRIQAWLALMDARPSVRAVREAGVLR